MDPFREKVRTKSMTRHRHRCLVHIVSLPPSPPSPITHVFHTVVSCIQSSIENPAAVAVSTTCDYSKETKFLFDVISVELIRAQPFSSPAYINIHIHTHTKCMHMISTHTHTTHTHTHTFPQTRAFPQHTHTCSLTHAFLQHTHTFPKHALHQMCCRADLAMVLVHTLESSEDRYLNLQVLGTFAHTCPFLVHTLTTSHITHSHHPILHLHSEEPKIKELGRQSVFRERNVSLLQHHYIIITSSLQHSIAMQVFYIQRCIQNYYL